EIAVADRPRTSRLARIGLTRILTRIGFAGIGLSRIVFPRQRGRAFAAVVGRLRHAAECAPNERRAHECLPSAFAASVPHDDSLPMSTARARTKRRVRDAALYAVAFIM